jgi:hypothetical protein
LRSGKLLWQNIKQLGMRAAGDAVLGDRQDSATFGNGRQFAVRQAGIAHAFIVP